MFFTHANLKPGMLVEVQDVHHSRPHIYEVSHVRYDIVRDTWVVVTNPALYEHYFSDVIAVYDRKGNGFVRIYDRDKDLDEEIIELVDDFATRQLIEVLEAMGVELPNYRFKEKEEFDNE